MIIRHLLKIAGKVRNIILLFMVVMLLFSPVKAQAHYPSVNPSTITAMAQKPNWGDFIGKEGLNIYGKHIQKQRAEEAKIIKQHRINYDSAKKNFISKHNRLKRDKLLKELWDVYKNKKDKLTRKQELDLIKILDIQVEKDRRAFPFWGEYYNKNHEIQDKLLSLFDKDSIKEIQEYLENPEKVKEKYDIDYSWDEKLTIKVGFWVRYSDSQIKDMDKEFSRMIEGDTYDRVRNWLEIELAPVKEHNKKQSITPLPMNPIAPGL